MQLKENGRNKSLCVKKPGNFSDLELTCVTRYLEKSSGIGLREYRDAASHLVSLGTRLSSRYLALCPPPIMAASSAFQFSAAKVTNPFPPSSQEGEWVQSLISATCSEHFYFLHFSNICSRLISFLSSGMFLHLPQWTQLQDHNLPLYASYDHRALEFQYNRLKDMTQWIFGLFR